MEVGRRLADDCPQPPSSPDLNRSYLHFCSFVVSGWYIWHFVCNWVNSSVYLVYYVLYHIGFCVICGFKGPSHKFSIKKSQYLFLIMYFYLFVATTWMWINSYIKTTRLLFFNYGTYDLMLRCIIYPYARVELTWRYMMIWVVILWLISPFLKKHCKILLIYWTSASCLQ